MLYTVNQEIKKTSLETETCLKREKNKITQLYFLFIQYYNPPYPFQNKMLIIKIVNYLPISSKLLYSNICIF